MNYHPVCKKITDLLKSRKVGFETFEHEAVRTSEEAAKVRSGYSLAQGAKALIVKVGSGNDFAMLVVPGDRKFSNSLAKKALGTSNLCFATKAQVSELTGGVKLGGVPPFGNLFNLKVVADPSLFDQQIIIFNAGDRRFSVAMKSQDYRKLVNPEVKRII